MLRDTHRTLAGMKVGLSGAMPDPVELEKNKWSESDIRMAVHFVVEAVVRRGGQIVHGNHPTYINLVRTAVSGLRACGMKFDAKPVKIFVVAPFVTEKEGSDLEAQHSDYAEVEFVGPFFTEGWPKNDIDAQRTSWLQAMREKMAHRIDALVCIGGRGARPDVPRPGVQVEATLTALAGKPFFLAANLGGYTNSLKNSKILSDLGIRGSLSLPPEIDSCEPSLITANILGNLERMWRAENVRPGVSLNFYASRCVDAKFGDALFPNPKAAVNTIKDLTLQLPIVGKVTSLGADYRSFKVMTRSGTEFEVFIKDTTWFDTVTNLDRLSRQRLPLELRTESDQTAAKDPGWVQACVKEGYLIAVEGIYTINQGYSRYEAQTIHLLMSHRKGLYLFEHTFWWKGQLEAMANKWLDVLFDDKRTYHLDDFSALYRTTLGIEGKPVDDHTQEMATLSRLIYGLSSAYLLGGDERYFRAAKAGVEFQREAFRSYSTDGRFCFWLHARKRDRHGIYDVLPSVQGEDAGTIPLYEQIYALAGLAQYYRITNDWETLQDIRLTLRTFNALFSDKSNGELHQGFFSHIDPVTFRWDSSNLKHSGADGTTDNQAKKNWNSIGDHLPAYLINLILAIDPLPVSVDDSDAAQRDADLDELRANAIEILDVTSRLILEKFPEEGNSYVNERFDRDFKPIHDWGWQQNRAVVGHNLKIAWNMTRVANYFKAKCDHQRAEKLFALAKRLGKEMSLYGIDRIRSGVYDTVERERTDQNVSTQFGWFNTKDFWQQEQGILAYLIMFGHFDDAGSEEAKDFLELARELSTVWNLYFLDRERNGIFFRVSDNGIPVLRSTYGDKGGHSISGYHAFELNYLAHVYQLAYLPRTNRQHTTFCLHFRPGKDSRLLSINVLPDFLGQDSVEIAEVVVDGVKRPVNDRQDFQIKLQPEDLGRHMVVRLCMTASAHARLLRFAPPGDDWLP